MDTDRIKRALKDLMHMMDMQDGEPAADAGTEIHEGSAPSMVKMDIVSAKPEDAGDDDVMDDGEDSDVPDMSAVRDKLMADRDSDVDLDALAHDHEGGSCSSDCPVRMGVKKRLGY